MNRYLTKKAKAWIRDILLAGFLILMTVLGIQASVEVFDPDEAVVSILASILMETLFALPLFFTVRRRYFSAVAERLSEALVKSERASVPAAELDALTGVRDARKKILVLMEKGFMQGLIYDEKTACFYLRGDAVTEPEPAPEPMAEDGYDGILRDIRRLNDEIDDELVSGRIDRLERVTAGIFETIRERPEKAEDARKLLGYYLPTTLKLLESYRLMERQSHQGDSIREARARIEEILEKLIYAFERQHDRLFLQEAMDVEAEIRAMETMLSADGLTPSSISLHG